MRVVWFITLFSTITLEGLGRKYLPEIPSVAFYFAKDVVLLIGFLFYPPSKSATRAGLWLFRGFKGLWLTGFVWTVVELLNPAQQSPILGLIGLRAYWFWWIAPFVISTVLQRASHKRMAVYVLLFFATGISIFAAVQFASPPDSALNLYSVVDGKEVYASEAIVSTTGRARVSSTFSYISGFSAFTTLVPALLLSIGLDARDRKLRRLALIVTFVTAAVVPMSGSRASVITGAAILIVAIWNAGLLATRIGRRIILVSAGAVVAASVVFPDALFGTQSRFGSSEETNTRFLIGAANILPPVALVIFDYPAFGIGTGMMQNARMPMGVRSAWDAEAESERYLVELGVGGFLVIWMVKMGLVVALLRARAILRRAGRRGASAAAMSYVVLTLVGSPPFDHVWQALYFLGWGIILAEVVAVERERAETAVLSDAAPDSRGSIADSPVGVASVTGGASSDSMLPP